MLTAVSLYFSAESSGDTSPPGDTLVAVLSRNLEAQRELPPTPTDQYHRAPTMIAEVMFRFKLFLGKHKV